MCRLTLALLLVAIAPWACLGAEQILYDFWSSQSTPTVLQAFQQVNVVYKLKVFGVNRYLILIENDQSTSMKNLRLPTDAYNVRTVSLEKEDVFCSHFDPTVPLRPNYWPLPESNLNFIERNVTVEYNEKELKAMIKEMTVLNLNINRDNEMFVATAGLPLRHIIITSKSDFEVSEMLLKEVDIYGGYDRLRVSIQKVHKI